MGGVIDRAKRRTALTSGLAAITGLSLLGVVGATAADAAPAPTVVTSAASAITPTTATLNGTINPNGTSTNYYFAWSVNSDLSSATDTSTAGPLTGHSTQAVSASISGLAPSTTYYFELVATNGTVLGGIKSFSTTVAVVTTAATAITATSAQLNGYLDPQGVPTSFEFIYSLHSNLASPMFTTMGNAGAGTDAVAVSATVGGLTPNTTYYFELVDTTTDTAGGILNFATGSGPVVTTAATSVGATSAQLNGTINPEGVATTIEFAYGTSPTLAGATVTSQQSVGSGTSAVAVAASVGGLTPNTTYYFELVDVTNDTLGGILSFTTLTSSAVITTAATSIGATTAELNGTINPEGVSTYVEFIYGTNSNLAGASATAEQFVGSGTSAVLVSAAVSGLLPNTTYYFELVDVTNDTVGGILAFTTAAGTPLPIQIFGVDPIGTSIAVSQDAFPSPLSAGAVVLARSDYYTDALAGGPLAAFVDGPLLLTEGAPISSAIDPRVLAEIERVLPAGGTVYVLGGSLALSPNIDAALSSLGYNVVREAGGDEYGTATDIAQAMGNPSQIFEATGTNYFDALSAVPAAIQQHAAILLTNGAQQSFATGLYLLAHPGVTRYAIGGPDQAAGADPGAIAVWGQTLFGTSAAVAQRFFPGAPIYGAATALSFSDALAGGVFMATGGRMGPLLIVNPFLPLAPEILGYLATLSTGAQGYVFGGPEALPGNVVTALQGAVG